MCRETNTTGNHTANFTLVCQRYLKNKYCCVVAIFACNGTESISFGDFTLTATQTLCVLSDLWYARKQNESAMFSCSCSWWPFFLFCVLAGHTSSSPTSYSTSHTETNSSGVPLIRTYVRTWFTHHIFLYLSNCVQKVTYGTSKGDPTCTQVPGWAKLFAETVALLWQKRKMWSFTLSEGLQWTQGSVCRYFWFINVMFVFEGLLNGELALQADVISSS